MSERLFEQDPYLLEFEATVTARRVHQGRPAVVLDRTAFYAESGGQPWDTGTLGEARVLAVLEADGALLHVLDRGLDEDAVRGRVDGDRRRDHRQQHHGQHLLSRAFVEQASAETTAFHLGSEMVTIDLDRPVTPECADAAERRANAIVWQALPVRVVAIPPDQARGTGLAVPAGVTGEVRVVEVEGFDRQPCGGTHPRTTAEVGLVLLTGLERYKSGTRVSFVCGDRALAALARWRRVVDGLVATLSAPVAELLVTAEKLKDDLAASERRASELLERVLDGEARRLIADHTAGSGSPTVSAPAVVVATYDGWPPHDLRVLASRLVALAPSVALLASRADKAHLVFAQSEGLPHDIPALLRDAVARLGGRGGGRGNLAQGGGDRIDRLDDALAGAAAAVRG